MQRAPSPEEYLDNIHNPPANAPFGGRLTFEQQCLVDWNLRQAALARENVGHFFGYVMREETTRARIRTLPHQRLVFEFTRHYTHCLLRLPVGFTKTYCMEALTLWKIGKDNTSRGALISSSEDQASKPLSAIRTYIEESAELKLVFPKLRPSSREHEPWTQTAITVDRPASIRDPSCIAVGLDSSRLPGARLNWANVDDILNEQNTSTDEQRRKVFRWIQSTVLTRLGEKRARCVVTNTPWHPEDATYKLEASGWPSMSIDCWGNIWFKNADDFDSKEIRLSFNDDGIDGKHRLAAHDSKQFVVPAALELPQAEQSAVLAESAKVGDVDAMEVVPTWPAKFPRSELESIKKKFDGGPEWFRAFELKTRSDEDSRVKEEWITAAKRAAYLLNYRSRVVRWERGNTFTGVDMASSRRKGSDWCTIFTFAVLDDARRLVLAADAGRYRGREFIDRIRAHHDAYESIVRVETNAFQDYLRQWSLEIDQSMRLVSHQTGRNKHGAQFGVESLFVELENGAWLLPSDAHGRVEKGVQHFIGDCYDYRPNLHTGDMLMAAWIAREQGRAAGVIGKTINFDADALAHLIAAR